jgi:hypothetical protein
MIQDADGNTINLASGGTDSLGRPISEFGNWATGNLSSCPNLGVSNQPAESAMSWTVPGAGTGLLTYTFCYTPIAIHTGFFPGAPIAWTNKTLDYYRAAVPVLQSVVPPNGTFWGFVYDSANPSPETTVAYGDLLELILPTGGSISYTWTNGGMCDPVPQGSRETRVLQTRTVNPGYGQAAGTWQYTVNPVAYTATVTNPDGSQVVHTFTDFSGDIACSLYETGTQYSTMTNGSLSLTRTVTTQYQVPASYWPEYSAAPLPNQITTTWPNGQTSYTTKAYDSGFATTSQMCYLYNSWNCQSVYSGTVPYGKVVSTSDYDGTNLLRTTSTNYQWQTNTNYLNANLLDTPTQVTVSGGGNT